MKEIFFIFPRFFFLETKFLKVKKIWILCFLLFKVQRKRFSQINDEFSPLRAHSVINYIYSPITGTGMKYKRKWEKCNSIQEMLSQAKYSAVVTFLCKMYLKRNFSFKALYFFKHKILCLCSICRYAMTWPWLWLIYFHRQ